MEPNVITYFCKGMFSFGVGHWVTKCERSGLKNPQMYFIQSQGMIVQRRAHIWSEKIQSSTGSISAIRSIKKIDHWWKVLMGIENRDFEIMSKWFIKGPKW
jgi:hypothetical protein